MIIAAFGLLNTFTIFAIYQYLPSLTLQTHDMWSSNDTRFFNIIRWPWLYLRILWALRKFRLIIAIQATFYLVFSLKMLKDGTSSDYSLALNGEFILAQMFSFVSTLAFLHFVLWVSNLSVQKYEYKVNNIQISVSLLKLEPIEANNHV